ncbi:hypothetical protein EIN_084610 [Entamoeba invadens IP1]|uniref:hypothetical protein n=1 Tax=Entamoeba invadens IP1 TaxID=370355 RepID=UPI0002C3ECC4|nr:hypothetical protein EIN_084610 [Entamoeba invadens IP1]ELP85269.1 hypothetical protein EIN_084610 [Entamoeba invadens IP1]|eukprot:XP_004184615.1 hypothetical protein EIN_084610 [Entamoeba invadens IP1]
MWRNRSLSTSSSRGRVETVFSSFYNVTLHKEDECYIGSLSIISNDGIAKLKFVPDNTTNTKNAFYFLFTSIFVNNLSHEQNNDAKFDFWYSERNNPVNLTFNSIPMRNHFVEGLKINGLHKSEATVPYTKTKSVDSIQPIQVENLPKTDRDNKNEKAEKSDRSEKTFFPKLFTLERRKTVFLGTQPVSPSTSPKPSLSPLNSPKNITKVEGADWSILSDIDSFQADESLITPTTPIMSVRKNLLMCGATESVRLLAWERCFVNNYKELYIPSLLIASHFDSMRSEDWKRCCEQIEKDLPRTEIGGVYLKKGEPLFAAIFRVLRAYCASHVDMGYSQGMSDILIVIAQVTTDEPRMFSLFVNIMFLVAPMWEKDGKNSVDSFSEILHFFDPKLHELISKSTTIKFRFVVPWMVVLFKRDFNREEILRVWDAIVAYPTHNFHFFIAAAIVMVQHENILKYIDDIELTMFISSMSEKIPVSIIYRADDYYKMFIDGGTNHALKQVFRTDEIVKRNQKNENPIFDSSFEGIKSPLEGLDDDKLKSLFLKIGNPPNIQQLPSSPSEKDIERCMMETLEFQTWCFKAHYFLTY